MKDSKLEFIIPFIVGIIIVLIISMAEVEVKNKNIENRIQDLEHQIQIRDSINAININKIDSITAQ